MTSTELLYALKEFTEETLKELKLPVRLQQSDSKQPEDRTPTVYLMRVPDSLSSTKKAPYILHQKVTGSDMQNPGRRTDSTCTVRSVFCIYHPDEQEGALTLNECMERMRIALLKTRVLAQQFEIIMTDGNNPQSLIYPDNKAPYFVGEMLTTWSLPPIEREGTMYEPYI
jgi:hypothetical protein